MLISKGMAFLIKEDFGRAFTSTQKLCQISELDGVGLKPAGMTMRLTSTVISISVVLLLWTQAHAVKWTKEIHGPSAGVRITGEIPDCWFSLTHYYIASLESVTTERVYDGLGRLTGLYSSGATTDGYRIQSHIYEGTYSGVGQVTAFGETRYYSESGNTYCIAVSNVTYGGVGNVLDGYDVDVTVPEAPVGRVYSGHRLRGCVGPDAICRSLAYATW